jgi:hypothetical protein
MVPEESGVKTPLTMIFTIGFALIFEQRRIAALLDNDPKSLQAEGVRERAQSLASNRSDRFQTWLRRSRSLHAGPPYNAAFPRGRIFPLPPNGGAPGIFALLEGCHCAKSPRIAVSEV